MKLISFCSWPHLQYLMATNCLMTHDLIFVGKVINMQPLFYFLILMVPILLELTTNNVRPAEDKILNKTDRFTYTCTIK